MYEEIGKAIRVPHIEWPDGSTFGRLLHEVDKVDHELCVILQWYRDVGLKVEEIGKQRGYKLVPIIDKDHWSEAEWERERQELMNHKDVLVNALKVL